MADPLVPGRLFATWTYGFRRELYRRDPGSTAWTLTNPVPGDETEALLAFHPLRPGTIWAATAHPLEVYRSTNAGGSWQRRLSAHSVERPLGLWSLRSGNRAVLLSWLGSRDTGWRLVRSLNEGQTWARIPGLQGPVAVLDGTSTAWAVADGGRALVETRNAGATWRRVARLPFVYADGNAEVLPGLFAVGGQRPVLLASSPQDGLFRSPDGGRTWRSVGPGGPGPAAVVAKGANLFAAFASGIHHSPDGGATWRLRSSPSLPPEVVSLAAASPSLLHAVSRRSTDLFQSRDGGRTWAHVSKQGVQLFHVEDFAWHPRDPRVQAILRLDPTADVHTPHLHLLSSRDGGATWRDAALQAFAFDPIDAGVLYGASEQGVFAARAGGAWVRLRHEPAAVLAHTGTALLAGGCGIARSHDDGHHWTEVLPCQAPLAYGLPAGATLLPRRMVAHPTHPAVVWAEIGEAYPREGGGTEEERQLYGSFDGGLTWERRPGSFPRVTLVPGRPDTVWDFGTVLRRSDDRGLTWTRVFVPGKIADIVADPFDGDRLLAGGQLAVLLTRNNGATWAPAFPIAELAPWGTLRQSFSRVFLHPTEPGRIAVAPYLGLLLRRAPLP